MKTQNFVTDLKQAIIDRLNDYSGNSYYGCDLAYTLFEGENVNGSVLCNTYQTKEFIKANFDLFGDLVEYFNDNLDMKLNPFSEPEKAHVILLLEASQSILSQLTFISENWNNSIELNDENIAIISNELTELNINDEDLF